MPAPLAAPGVELDIDDPAPNFSLKRAGPMQSSLCTPQEALFRAVSKDKLTLAPFPSSRRPLFTENGRERLGQASRLILLWICLGSQVFVSVEVPGIRDGIAGIGGFCFASVKLSIFPSGLLGRL